MLLRGRALQAPDLLRGAWEQAGPRAEHTAESCCRPQENHAPQCALDLPSLSSEMHAGKQQRAGHRGPGGQGGQVTHPSHPQETSCHEVKPSSAAGGCGVSFLLIRRAPMLLGLGMPALTSHRAVRPFPMGAQRLPMPSLFNPVLTPGTQLPMPTPTG